MHQIKSFIDFCKWHNACDEFVHFDTAIHVAINQLRNRITTFPSYDTEKRVGSKKIIFLVHTTKCRSFPHTSNHKLKRASGNFYTLYKKCCSMPIKSDETYLVQLQPRQLL